ncbi:hypothetical protein QE382_001086 [Sphingobacterium zeae]|uniref:Uncharacterized protein n=1 Tax=Sphingobacterium zeae TaxID=1776859 RepID=A0ABU0U2C4_9SPHI|nr:hypothetical protein [Sphingobacterium zeae]
MYLYLLSTILSDAFPYLLKTTHKRFEHTYVMIKYYLNEVTIVNLKKNINFLW